MPVPPLPDVAALDTTPQFRRGGSPSLRLAAHPAGAAQPLSGLAGLRELYASSLNAAGGTALEAGDLVVVTSMLAEHCRQARLTRVASTVPGLAPLPGQIMVDVTRVNDPHDLVEIELAVVPGRFAVAENGAVWVSGAELRQRALLFTCEHLALVVPGGDVVANMHEAYHRLSLGPQGTGGSAAPPFGVFIAGPSKTADIEQALVLGAHGPRSLVVFLVGGPRD